ncbi:MAG TPA: hypothetical protein VI756_14990 [Blastocatellia bacterium]
MSGRQCLKSTSKRLSEAPGGSAWDEAISDAEAMLKETRAKAKELVETIRIFKRRRDDGELFFGQGRPTDKSAKAR